MSKLAIHLVFIMIIGLNIAINFTQHITETINSELIILRILSLFGTFVLYYYALKYWRKKELWKKNL